MMLTNGMKEVSLGGKCFFLKTALLLMSLLSFAIAAACAIHIRAEKGGVGWMDINLSSCFQSIKSLEVGRQPTESYNVH